LRNSHFLIMKWKRMKKAEMTNRIYNHLDYVKPIYIFKICLVGGPGVGKTCIARRVSFNTFDINTKLTFGIEFYTYDLPIIVDREETYIRGSIWEFGGQEHFKKLFPYYINGASGIFLIFDLANIETLTKLDWWYDKLIEYHMVDHPKILIGTKLDLVDEESMQFRNDELTIKEFAYNHDEIEFIKTSAKENINIKDIFKEMVKKVLDYHNLEYERIT
ncbi:MAG: Rab family GTPase, partial [Promethearchaeota archaeon]